MILFCQEGSGACQHPNNQTPGLRMPIFQPVVSLSTELVPSSKRSALDFSRLHSLLAALSNLQGCLLFSFTFRETGSRQGGSDVSVDLIFHFQSRAIR